MGIFLLGSNDACPAHAFADNPIDNHTYLLAAGYGVPLMWFFLYRPAHLHAYPRLADRDDDPDVRIPATTTREAANTLLDRRALVNSWFGQSGALDRHINVFATWLSALPYRYVTLDWWEVCIEEGQAMADSLVLAIERIEARDATAVGLLADLSTTQPEHGFPYLEGDPASFTQEQVSNFWMLLGDTYDAPIPWP